MIDLVELTVLALLWALLAWRLVKGRSSPPGRTVTVFLAATAVSATVNRSEVTALLDRLSGVPDIAVPTKNLALVAAAAATVRLAGMLSRPGAGRSLRRTAYVVLASAAAGMVALFLRIPRRPGAGDFVDEQATSAAAAGYGLLTQLCLSIGLAAAVSVSWRHSRRTAPGPLRTGLIIMTVGAGVGALYLGNRIAFLLSHLVGSHAIEGPTYVAISRTLLLATLLLLAVGLAVPAVGTTWRGVSRYAALQRLYPLWRDLRGVVPEIVLGEARGRLSDLLTPNHVNLRLCRRLIEIRDAQWLLGARVSPALLDAARDHVERLSVRPEAQAAAVEACVLRAAVTTDMAPAPGSGADPGAPQARPEVDAEVEALLAVARLYRSPLAREFAGRFAAERPDRRGAVSAPPQRRP